MIRAAISRRRRNMIRLQCEYLEDRRVLATFSVNNLGDTSDANPGDGIAADVAGNTTLRAAIEEANALAGADDINFAVAGTVSLTLGELLITSDLDIDGGNAITVDAGGASRVVKIDNGDGILANRTVSLANITISGGSALLGGGIYSAESTTLDGATVSGNSVTDGASYAFGGGILNTGTMSILNSTISGNSAIHPIGSAGLSGTGGGVTNYKPDAVMYIENSMISNNSATKFGGGIVNAQGYLRLTNSTVDANLAGSNDYYTGGAGVASLTYLASGNDAFETVIQSSTISNNVLQSGNFPYGSGLYASGYGTFTMNGSTISGNTATGGGSRGGGAMFYGYIASPGIMYVTISDSQFDSNYTDGDGAGLAVRGREDTSVRIEMTDVDFTSNVAAYGGAIWNWSPRSAGPDDARITLVNSSITGNSGTTEGIIENLTGGQLTVRNSNLSGNSSGTAVLYNQGITLVDGYLIPELTIENSTVANNTSTGYAAAVSSYDGSTTILQSTISGNTATGSGTISVRTSYAYVGTPMQGFTNVLRSTVTNNTASIGGGLFVNQYSTVNVRNSIISGNSGAGSPNIYLAVGGTVTANYSLIGDNTGSGLPTGNPDPNGNIIGDSVTPISAQLSLLGNYGGPTMTHVPMVGSPAIDAGDPSITGGTDQRGFNRVVNSRMDMGSTEFGATAAIDGDFNNDGMWNCTDINMLTAVTAAMSNDPNFDLNGDNFVNDLDIMAWLVEGGAMNPAQTGGNPFLAGDANLDGVVDGQDFIIWNGNKFTSNTDWCGGNFNGDSVVDGQDFITWNQNKFMSSDRLNRDGAVADWSVDRGLTRGKGNHPERTGAAWLDRVTQQPARLQRLDAVQASSTQEAILKKMESVPQQPDIQRLQSPAVNLSAHQVRSFPEANHRRVTTEAIDSIFADVGCLPPVRFARTM